LDQAQEAKKRHLAAKLLLQPNQRVLDIGCGWGGLALDIARAHEVSVEGITLSHEQLAVAKARASDEGLDDAVRFHLEDYRNVRGQFERIVSVGMFEHVGIPYYDEFFRKIYDLLAPDGVALIHSIGSITDPGMGNRWIQKHIFPGGYTPALSDVWPAIETSGLIVTDVEILRLHYAETLKHWRERFVTNWAQIAHLYDERFKRMWEFYLAACEMSFRHGLLMVFQIQLAKRLDAVPLTRDYIYQAEHNGAAGIRDAGERAA
jgi:cyclopropane-fatty-acyl-phospholipid synthase